jgi:hypothetical protein
VGARDELPHASTAPPSSAARGAGSSVDLDVIAAPSRANPARDGLPDALDSDAFAASADINREQAIRSSRAW